MAKMKYPPPRISIVVPLYNEEETLPALHHRLLRLINESRLSIEAVLVDDGSRDTTSRMISMIAASDRRFTAVILSRNFGHQLALTAGLANASCTEAVFIIDGDLQDPPEMLSVFYSQLRKGFDVVYGIRRQRKENILKRLSYSLFYRILKSISYTSIPLDSGDFCLISRKVVDILNQMPEESRFLRGMRSWVGFNQIGIPYERDKRKEGKTKYSPSKLLRLALTGIYNFSEIPIRFMTMLGFSIVSFSTVYFVYCLVRKLTYHDVPQGFTMLFFAILLFSGVQLVSLGILGEYILRIFFQVKGRPHFIVSRIVRRGGEGFHERK
jgi:dolichol-phosphate mannosyltransferase